EVYHPEAVLLDEVRIRLAEFIDRVSTAATLWNPHHQSARWLRASRKSGDSRRHTLRPVTIPQHRHPLGSGLVESDLVYLPIRRVRIRIVRPGRPRLLDAR